jgi:hypothetical protein
MLTKREWIEEFKKLSTNFKIDERNMIQSHLSEDYHANKIFNSLCSEAEDEKKYVDNAIEKIKLSVNDIYAYLKGYQKGKNLEIRQKIIKIEEQINRNRLDFKNKFENLLMQEEELENELMKLESNFEFQDAIGENNNKNIGDNNKDENNENNLGEGDNKLNNKKQNNNCNKNNPEKISIESYIEYIFSNAFNNNIFEEFSENKITKLVGKITDLSYIKDKTYLIEIMIDKNLSGLNCGWQPREHQEFLKQRAAHNNKTGTYDFLAELETTLPFIPKSELKNHIKEHSRFLKLTELKKLLIARYKEIKTESDIAEKLKLLENIEKQKQSEYFKKNIRVNNFLKANPNLLKDGEASESKILNAIELDNHEKQKKLEEWKQLKEQKKRELDDLKYREEFERRENERFLYEEKKKMLQPQLEEYKKYKNYIKQEQEYIKQLSLLENKADINEIDLERIKEKNNKILDKRLSNAKAKSVLKLKNAEQYAKFKIKKIHELEKVDSKLTSQTEAIKEKQRKKHDYTTNKVADTMGGNVLGHTARAVPEWRKGLFS